MKSEKTTKRPALPARLGVGKVTAAERDEIKRLFERRNGLLELLRGISDPAHPLYDRLVQDMGETATRVPEVVGREEPAVRVEGRGRRPMGDRFRHLRDLPEEERLNPELRPRAPSAGPS